MYYIIKQRFSFTVRRLSLCQDLDHSSCGDVLFHGSLGPPCKLYSIKVALYKDFFPPIFHLKTAVTFLILHHN